ncbi:MAG: primosomal protein N' [Bacillota bacterium]
MFARVIVGIHTSELDRVFDYIVGEEWLGLCQRGVRVVVPFGAKNTKIEGYVLSLAETTKIPMDRMKAIKEVLDDGTVLFLPHLLLLAEFMQKKYFTTLSQCLQTIMPTGVKMKSRIYIVVKSTVDASTFSEIECDIINHLRTEKKHLQYSDLQKKFGGDIVKTVDKMVQKGILDTYQKIYQDNFKKEEVTYRLAEKTPDMMALFEAVLNHKSAVKQQQVLALLEHGAVLSSESLKKSDITSANLKPLIEKGIVVKEQKEVLRTVYDTSLFQKTTAFSPTAGQTVVLEQITDMMHADLEEKKPILLHGVTGSGKTEIYMQIIEKALCEGKEAIVLVPEISLTPQMMERLIGRFGSRVAITHSRMTNAERLDQWKKARTGEISVILGPRSALFTPFSNLGVIVIDEVHESTYTSDTTPKYDAKEVAIHLGKLTGAVVIFGSATPLVEQFYKAKQGEYEYISLEEKAAKGKPPEVHLVDMRKELADGNRTPFSSGLQKAIRETLAKGEQCILFLNRRGYATFVSCRNCGLVMECPECQLPYTYHDKGKMLMCHHCGRVEIPPKICPACQSKYIRFFGTGTQKIEEAAMKLFPEAVTLRMDFDTTQGKFGYDKILSAFKNRQCDILIGTQMIAKGHDYSNVTLVGIMAADTSLYTSSFYGAENTFHLIVQSAGRTGRSDKGGRVYLQTYQPDHYAVQHGKDLDYLGFYEKEISYRNLMQYPPFGTFFSVVVGGEKEEKAKKIADKLVEILSKDDRFLTMGPAPTIQRKNDQGYGFRILLQGSTDEESLVAHVLSALAKVKKSAGADIYFNLNLNPRHIV